MRVALRNLDQNKMQSVLTLKGTKWTFNPTVWFHYRGTWEQIIRLMRKVLYSILRQQTLDDDSSCTILWEVEAVLNFLMTLMTWRYFLLKQLITSSVEIQITSSWTFWGKLVQYLSDLFWKRRVREHLPVLQERQKWTNACRNFSVNDIVVIMDASAQRSSRLTGKVTKTCPDRKGAVQSVQLKLYNYGV